MQIPIIVVDSTCNGGFEALDLVVALDLAGKMAGTATSSLKEDFPTAAARPEDMGMLMPGLGGTGCWVDSGGNENGPRGTTVVFVVVEVPEEPRDADQ